MVKRLIVVLLSVSLGFAFLSSDQQSIAQTELGKKTRAERPVATPILLSQEQAFTVPIVGPIQDPEETPQQDPVKNPVTDPVKESKPDPADTPAKDPVEKQTPDTDKKSTQDPNKKPAEAPVEKPADAMSEKKPTESVPATAGDTEKDAQDTEKDAQDTEGKTPTKTDAIPQEEDDQQVDAKVANKTMSEHLLPPTTKAWISIPNAVALQEQFEMTQLGSLAEEPALEPFIESMREQIKDWVDGQNVRFGIKLSDLEDVNSGEICIAGILPEAIDGQAGGKRHGLVFLMDVSNSQDNALALQEKIQKELADRGAEQVKIDIHGVSVAKSTIKKPRKFRQIRTNFQVIVNGWMLVSDNENVFRDVLSRLTAKGKPNLDMTLGGQARFEAIMDRTSLGEFDSQVRWFVDPFGYLKLIEKLEDEERTTRVAHDDIAERLRSNGFNAIQGVGGNVAIATGRHEVLHRTFVYAPRNSKDPFGKFVFDLFDFDVNNGTELEPAKWIPANCSAFIVGQWDFQKALGGVGHFYDTVVVETEDAFERMLADFKSDPDYELDVKKLVGQLDNRFTMVSEVEHPITEDSERVAFGFPITGEPEFVFKSIERASQGKVINLGGVPVIKVETVTEDPEDDVLGDLDDFGVDDDPELEEEEEKRDFKLFKERYFVVTDGYLIVANNKEFIRKLINQRKSHLVDAPDYVEVRDSLSELTVAANVNWRQFGRLDRALETNYEMMRRGEMAKSQTVLARIINQLFAKRAAAVAEAEGEKADPDAVRKQKIDGSKLPKDYATSIAPYLGPVGWVLETEKDGWRVTGCLLKKKQITEIVRKEDEGEDGSSRR